MANPSHLHRQQLPQGTLLHSLFASQNLSRIQNGVRRWYESELTVTLSGITVMGCQLQDIRGSVLPCGSASTLTATTGGSRCLPTPGARIRGLRSHSCCTTEKQKGDLQERFFGARSWYFSKCKGVFSVMPPFCCRVGRGKLEDHLSALFLLWAEKGLEATSPSIPAAIPVTS